MFRAIWEERTGLVAAVAVFLLCAIVARVALAPLGAPGRLLTTQLIAKLGVGDCSALGLGTTEMYLCSARIALFTIIGPLLMLVILFMLRSPIRASLRRLANTLAPEYRYLVSPLATTLIFMVYWGGAHNFADTNVAEARGIVSFSVFPALIGLLTFAGARYSPAIQKGLAEFFSARDRVPRVVRALLVALLPLAVAFLLTQGQAVTVPAVREQAIILGALVFGYFMFTARRATPVHVRASAPLVARVAP